MEIFVKVMKQAPNLSPSSVLLLGDLILKGNNKGKSFPGAIARIAHSFDTEIWCQVWTPCK